MRFGSAARVHLEVARGVGEYNCCIEGDRNGVGRRTWRDVGNSQSMLTTGDKNCIARVAGIL